MTIALRADNVGKRYRLGQTHAGSVREVVNRAWQRLRGRRDRLLPHQHNELHALSGDRVEGDGSFWALRDVSFEVRPGEVVGIIGRNGSGKSTLLKIFSQITAPTTGRVELHGRVASLLEVGTGFHPELSGRENVFLNGAILGMTKPEIRRKFDEIVAFAEIETFIDTPVKRYSSGMYVRLAFAIAAYLDPEILIVDEVLAVGDAAFQAKCLAKMAECSGGGRTVLFVSHNIGAVTRLCTSALLLRDGALVRRGEVSEVLGHYLSAEIRPTFQTGDLEMKVSYVNEDGKRGTWREGCDLCVRTELRLAEPVSEPAVDLAFFSVDGTRLISLQSDRMTHEETPRSVREWVFEFRVRNPGLSACVLRLDVGVRLRGELAYAGRWEQVEMIPVGGQREQLSRSEALLHPWSVVRVESVN